MARDTQVDDIIASFRDFASGGIYLPEVLQTAVANVIGSMYRHHYDETSITAEDTGERESIFRWMQSERGMRAIAEVAATDVSGIIRQLPGMGAPKNPNIIPNFIPRSVSVNPNEADQHPFYDPSVGTFQRGGKTYIPIPQQIRQAYWQKTKQGILAVQNAQTGSDLTALLHESSRGIIAQSAAHAVRRGMDPSEAIGNASLNLYYRMASFSPTYGEGNKQSSWPLWAAFGGRQAVTDIIDFDAANRRTNTVSINAFEGAEAYFQFQGRGDIDTAFDMMPIQKKEGTLTFPTILTTTGGLYTKNKTAFASVHYDPFGRGKKGYSPLTLTEDDMRRLTDYVSRSRPGVKRVPLEFEQELPSGLRYVPKKGENLDFIVGTMRNELEAQTTMREGLRDPFEDPAESNIEFSYTGGGGDFTTEEANVAGLQRKLDQRNARVRVEASTSWYDRQGNPLSGDPLDADIRDINARTNFNIVGGGSTYDDPFGDANLNASMSLNYEYATRKGKWKANWPRGKGPANPLEAIEQGAVTHIAAFRSTDRDTLAGMSKGDELTVRGHGLEITGKVGTLSTFTADDIKESQIRGIARATGLAPWYIRGMIKRSGSLDVIGFKPTDVDVIDESVTNLTPAEYAELSRQKKIEAAEALETAADSPGSIAARNILQNKGVGKFRDEYAEVDPETNLMERAFYPKLSRAASVIKQRAGLGTTQAPAKTGTISAPPPEGQFIDWEPSEEDMNWAAQQYEPYIPMPEEPPTVGTAIPAEPAPATLAPAGAAPPPAPPGPPDEPPPPNEPPDEPPDEPPGKGPERFERRREPYRSISRRPRMGPERYLDYQKEVSSYASKFLYKGKGLREVLKPLPPYMRHDVVSKIRSQRVADAANTALGTGTSGAPPPPDELHERLVYDHITKSRVPESVVNPTLSGTTAPTELTWWDRFTAATSGTGGAKPAKTSQYYSSTTRPATPIQQQVQPTQYFSDTTRPAIPAAPATPATGGPGTYSNLFYSSAQVGTIDPSGKYYLNKKREWVPYDPSSQSGREAYAAETERRFSDGDEPRVGVNINPDTGAWMSGGSSSGSAGGGATGQTGSVSLTGNQARAQLLASMQSSPDTAGAGAFTQFTDAAVSMTAGVANSGGSGWHGVSDLEFKKRAVEGMATANLSWLTSKWQERKPDTRLGTPHVTKRTAGIVTGLEFVEPSSITRGMHEFTEESDWAGNKYKILKPEQEGLITKTSSAVVGQSYAVFQAGMAEALSKPIDMSQGGENAMATLRARIDKYANDYVKRIIKDAGDDPDAIRQADITGTQIKTLVKGFTQQVGDAVNRDRGNLAPIDWQQTYGQRLYKASDIQQMGKAYPDFAQWVNQQGGPSAVLHGTPNAFTTSTGQRFVVGMGGYDDLPPDDGSRGPTSRANKLWSSPLGQALYGMYIGRRIWSWTAGQAAAQADIYGQYVSGFAPSLGGVAATGDQGYAARKDLGALWMAEGAYQQFGGFSTAAYALSGYGTTIPRAAAGLQLVGGLAGAGYMTALTGSAMTHFGGSAAIAGGAGLASSAMMIGAGGLLASLGGMELYNAFIKPQQEQPKSFGNLAAQFTSSLSYAEGYLKYLKDTEGEPNFAESAIRLIRSMDPDKSPKWLTERGYMTRQGYYAHQAAYAPIDQELEQLKGITESVSAITGEKPGAVQPYVRQLYRSYGVMDPYKYEEFAVAAQRMNMTVGEYSQLYSSTMSTMGIYSGTDEARLLMEQFSKFGNLGEAERFAGRQSVYARYGGMLSQYVGSSSYAMELARKYDLTTMGQTQGLATMMSVADMYEVDLDKVIGTRTTHRPDATTVGGKAVEEEITIGDELATRAKRIGNVRAQVSGSAAAFLTKYGVPISDALGWVEEYGIMDEREWERSQSLIEVVGQYQNNLSTQDMANLTLAGKDLTKYEQEQLKSILSRVAPGTTSGTQLGQLAQLLATSGLSSGDYFNVSQMMSGDLGAWSFQSYQQDNYYGRFMDMAKRPIYMSSLQDMMQMSFYQAAGGNPYGILSKDPLSYLGIQSLGDDEAIQAWLSGGQIGRTELHRTRMREYELAQMDLSQKRFASGVLHTEQMWGLQDQQRELSHQSQLASFAASWQRLELRNQFGVAQEDLSLRRMGARFAYADISAAINLQRLDLRELFGGRQAALQQQGMEARQEWQLYNMQFGRENALLQRQWTQADWGYSDQMRGLQFGWNIEDINEQIRRSTGYQRRQLLKRRERMVLSHNLEEGHIDEQRERQEEMWAREDEHYEKLKKYTEDQMSLEKEQYDLNEQQRKTLIQLDREAFEAQERYRVEMQQLEVEQFELSKQQREAYYQIEREELARRQSEYMEQYNLQTQIIDLQRAQQREQWDYQQRSLDLNRMIAEENWKYQSELMNVSNIYNSIVGHFQMMAAYDPSFQLSQLVNFIQQINMVDPYRLMLLSDIMATMR